MTGGSLRCRVLADPDRLAAAAARRMLRAADRAIAARGEFHLVLAGGRTPLPAYARLARAQAQWPHWHLYFGDERWLPAGHPDRNETAVRRAWLDLVPIPAAQVHAIPAGPDPERAADSYRALLAAVPAFDLVLLGLGADGHTASLFPGRRWGPGPVLVVRAAPGPHPLRISLGVERLRCSRQLLFLVSGADKRAALDAWRRGGSLPAAAVAEGHPRALVLLDAAADPGRG
ncbi:MAG: 6-phosphogluconolactonase [Pseudomonadota bacterium]|jgi:6-phosphogluconolactonase